jgi:hypothetical protein
MKKHVLFSTDLDNYPRELFDEECKENDLEPTDERYWEWVGERQRWDWEDLIENIKYSEFNTRCVIMGELGLWNGTPVIDPVICNTLVEAIMKCNGRDIMDIDIYKNHSAIEVCAHHHDGTNRFKIKLLNERGINTEMGNITNRRYHLTLPEYLF